MKHCQQLFIIYPLMHFVHFQIFTGNNRADWYIPNKHDLGSPVLARSLRVVAVTGNYYGLRLEFYGCGNTCFFKNEGLHEGKISYLFSKNSAAADPLQIFISEQPSHIYVIFCYGFVLSEMYCGTQRFNFHFAIQTFLYLF